ncbi:MAG: hypothetical protein ABIK28_08735 [Planctomycetota bacterium]
MDRDMTLVNVSTPVPSGNGEARLRYLPLGCLYLLSALEEAGMDVDFRDYQVFLSDDSDPLDRSLDPRTCFLRSSKIQRRYWA